MIYSLISIVSLLAVLLLNYEVFFSKNYVTNNKKAHNSYKFFLISLCAFYVCDIAWGICNYIGNDTALFVITSLFFTFMGLVILSWSAFVNRYLEPKKVYYYIFMSACWVVALMGVVLVIINIFHPVLFYIGENNYNTEMGRYVYFISQVVIFFFLSLYSLLSAFIFKSKRKVQHIAIASFGVSMVTAIILQLMLPLYPIYSIGCTVGVMELHSFLIVIEKTARAKELKESKIKEKEQQKEIGTVRRLAYIDSLTGVKNKHAFVEYEKEIDDAIRENKVEEFSLFIFDLNDLKLINDEYGHEIGDLYIKKSVKLIQDVFINADIYRYGGDEFVVVLKGELFNNRYKLLEKFNSIIDTNVKENNKEPVVALGFSDYISGNDHTIRSVFSRADERMYSRKKRLKSLQHIDEQIERNNNFSKVSNNLRYEMYEMFYNNSNILLIEMLNNSTCDEILEVDLNNDTFKQYYHVDGKYAIPNVGLSYEELLDFTYKYIVHPDDRGIYYNLMKKEGFFERLRNARIPNFDFAHFRYKLQGGDYRYVEQVVITGEEYGIPEGMFRMYVIDINNIMSRQLGKISNESGIIAIGRDETTGLLTGKEVFTAADNAIKKDESDRKWCLIAMDIEHFKFFDEWYGREKGDYLLAQIGGELTRAEEVTGGVAGYFGQDDFVLVVPYNEEKIVRLYNNINDLIKNSVQSTGFKIAMGVAIIEKDMLLTDALDRATIAVTTAKQELTNCISLYDYETQFKAEQDYRVLTECIKAMQTNEISFYLQPQCRLNNGKIVGAEALARWIKKDGTIISPATFIQVLEKYGFIPDFDKYIWERVVMWQGNWIKANHKPIPVSVNVSRLDILTMDVLTTFIELTMKYKVPHNLLKIEITESAYAETTNEIEDLVKSLRKEGFLVFMDDFGSGYSSLNMLSTIEIDAIKVDAYFLHFNGEDDEKSIRILETIVDMAKSMALPIIMEGVETKEQADFLKDLGCQFVQGYYFYKPMPISEFEKLISDKKKIDKGGLAVNTNENFRVREFFDESIYSDSMLNSVIGAVAIYEYHDGHLDIVRFNQQFYESVNVPDFAERLVAIENFVPIADRPGLFKSLEDAKINKMSGGISYVRFFRSDGLLLHYKMHFYYLGEREGASRYYGSAENITELMDLKQIKDLFSTYSSENMIFVKKDYGKWVYTVISHTLSDVIGLSPKELEEELNDGRFVKRVCNQRNFKTFMKDVNHLADQHKDFKKNISIYDKDHKKIKVELDFKYIPGDNTNTCYIFYTKVIK